MSLHSNECWQEATDSGFRYPLAAGCIAAPGKAVSLANSNIRHYRDVFRTGSRVGTGA